MEMNRTAGSPRARLPGPSPFAPSPLLPLAPALPDPGSRRGPLVWTRSPRAWVATRAGIQAGGLLGFPVFRRLPQALYSEIATFLKENGPRDKVHTRGEAQRKVSGSCVLEVEATYPHSASVPAQTDIKERIRRRECLLVESLFLEGVEGDVLLVVETKLPPGSLIGYFKISDRILRLKVPRDFFKTEAVRLQHSGLTCIGASKKVCPWLLETHERAKFIKPCTKQLPLNG